MIQYLKVYACDFVFVLGVRLHEYYDTDRTVYTKSYLSVYVYFIAKYNYSEDRVNNLTNFVVIIFENSN